jgi:Ca2+-binding EF-hand superfamily protein
MSMAIGGLESMSQVSLTKMHQEMFKKLDQNKDGKVDKAEFAAARPKDDTRKTDETGKLDEMFAQIDTDQDGSITAAESDAFLTKMDQQRATRGLQGPGGVSGMPESTSAADVRKKLFDSLDQNKDGKVDKAEFAAARPKDGTRKTDETGKLDEMFAQIDTDQDGSITAAESDAFLTKMEEGKKSHQAPPPPKPDWQTGLLQAVYANASATGAQASTAVSLYA